MRLIDADYLMCDIGCFNAVKYGNETPEQQHNSYSTLMMYEIAEYINDAETVDAEPVRHGRWEKRKNCLWRCSECEQIPPYDVIGDDVSYWECQYCPNCGAKMDAEVQNDA